jgi:hypothetical protein
MFGQIRCGVKYHNQPIHWYVMPHAPGQEPGFLRRNMLLSVGFGTRHIDSFWVAPPETYTENFVSWGYRDTFRVIHESIFDSAEIEKIQSTGKVRSGRVAIITGKATDYNESKLMLPKEKDPFAKDCKNAPPQLNQIICRKDQQMLYCALRHTQNMVDLITEDDIMELDILKNYDVVYFAGEWIDNRILKKLDPWVQAGGVFYVTAGCGHLNQYNEPEAAMSQFLGLKSIETTKNCLIVRTLLELPLMAPIDTLSLASGGKVQAIGMKQKLTPADAKVIGTWSDGSAAATVRDLGKGKIFAVGTLAGNSYMKTGTRVTPWARGGKQMLYNPTGFSADSTTLVRLGVEARKPQQDVICSEALVEGVLIDSKEGTLLTLANWTNGPVKGLKVSVRTPTAAPKEVKSVQQQKVFSSDYKDGFATFTIDLEEADFVTLK